MDDNQQIAPIRQQQETEQRAISHLVVHKIAMDIGKAVAEHIETMYPAAVTATSPTMLISLRNTAYNEIMAALDTTDEVEILARLERRAQDRRRNKAAWKALRGNAR